jgi:hypothetical protein
VVFCWTLACFVTWLTTALSGTSAHAMGSEACAPYAPLLQWQTKTYERTTLGVQASQRERFEAATEVAKLLFRGYLAGKDVALSGRGCPLQEDARRELEFARGPVFFQRHARP